MRVEAIIEEYQTYGLPADLTPVALPPARLVQCVYSSSYCYYLPDDDATPFAALADSLRNAIAVQAEVLSSLLPEDNNAIAVSIHVKNATNEYTVLKLVDADILSPPPIFASFKQCFINGLCSQNYETSNGKFDFRVFEKSQGIRLSPLQFYNKPVDNSNIFAYSRTNSLNGALRTITLYFDGTFQNATSAQSTTFGNKNALLVSDPVAGMQPLSVLWNERKAPSLWQLNALDETYRQTMKSLFTAGLEKGSVFVPIENGKEAEAELTSPGGLRVRAVVGWTNNNLASEAMTYGAQYKSEDMGGQISLFAIYIISAFFIYKYSLVTSFVVQILTSVLKDIKDLGSVVRDENIFATNFDHIHFKEIRDLVIQMANYKMLVQFIATIKSKDALNPMKLKHFLLPFQNTDNHAANVYLFNFFSRLRLTASEGVLRAG
jgi:hypothetical protein